MKFFTVILQEIVEGCSVGSTEDVFEAATAEEAEAAAIAAWTAVKPGRKFAPLLTIENTDRRPANSVADGRGGWVVSDEHGECSR